MSDLPEHRVSTYGGETVPTWSGPYTTTQHWQLRCFGEFIADTSNPQHAEIFEKIVEALNDPRCPATDGSDRCQFWRGHPHRHQILDGRSAQGSA